MAWQMEQLTVSPRALEDIVVVEVGHGVALGYCGALLRACGATLTKVEVSSAIQFGTPHHLPPTPRHLRRAVCTPERVKRSCADQYG